MKRTAALVAGLSALVVTAVPAASAQETPDRVRVVHVTVDSLHPSQVGPQTPVLQGLKADGTWYEQSRAVMASETLPNHVAMGTGTYPEVNGIPGNGGRAQIGDTAEADPDLGQPELLQADSVTRTIERVCPDLRTVTVFSKEYVHRIFAADGADSDFPQSTFNIPGSGHAPDTSTVGYLLQDLAQADPDYVFANLGDVDRAGHIDTTGATGVPLTQLAALEQTDELIGTLVAELQARGLWEETVLIINSDHSMDWSVAADPSVAVDVGGALEADPATAGRFFVAENGGAALVYLTDPSAADADEVLQAARGVITGLDGVDEALYREPNPLDPGHDLDTVHPAWRLGTPRVGELFVTVQPGFKVGTVSSNPVPGNHGHTIARHNTMLITGGWDGLNAPRSIAPSDPDAVDTVHFDDTEALPEQAENVDVAPTIGWLLGVPDPRAPLEEDELPQWQGRVLSEAFARQPAPVCVQAAGDGGAAPAPSPEPAPEDADTPVLPTTGGGLAIGGVLAAVAVGLGGRRRRRR